MPLLQIAGISKRFGRVSAVSDVSFEVERGELLALIGPNGAGKSTVFNAITGIYTLDAGRIDFDGTRIDGRQTFRIAAMGIARTFQNIRLFRFMPAIDNVMAGEHARLHASIFASMLHVPSERREERAARERARELLAFVGLERAADMQAGSLDYGSQRRLEIARALASSPQLLLLDEPAAGMNPREKESLRDLLFAIRDRGVTQMLVEHDMSLVMKAAARIVVLDHGEKIAEGDPQSIRGNRSVIEAYLGDRRVSLLDIRGLDVRYGGIAALHGIDLHVEAGEIVALLGANGAGKTTTLGAISGLLPWKGEISFDGASLRGKPADKIARSGLNHVPEGRRIFTRMTVRENLELGAFGESSRTAIGSREAFVLDAFPRLKERIDQSAATLSGGEQQMLAIGRALMGSPRLLMLDEPSLGLAPIVIESIFAMICELNASGTTMLLVEQNARQALKVAHRAYVLESGTIVREGKAADLLDDPAVVAAYLGATI